MAKKVTIKDLTDKVNETLIDDVDVQWNGLDIHIKKRLGVAEMLDFINTVVAWCVDEDTGEYRPEWKLFSYDSELVEKYTNLTLPKDLEKRYRILLCNDLINTIIRNVDSVQLETIYYAIEDRIRYILRSTSSTVYKQMSDVVDAFSQMKDVANEMFTNENAATLTKFMETVNNVETANDKAVQIFKKLEENNE